MGREAVEEMPDITFWPIKRRMCVCVHARTHTQTQNSTEQRPWHLISLSWFALFSLVLILSVLYPFSSYWKLMRSLAWLPHSSLCNVKFLEFPSEFVLNTFSNTFYLHVWMFWLYVYMCTTYVQWPWRLEKNITPETGGRRRGEHNNRNEFRFSARAASIHTSLQLYFYFFLFFF